ncbi:MAG TPA: hypothetical protein VFC46_16050 [Humisphaera sp.]|nr:hypothetical protein [Humisphaera sp.]
MDKGSLVMEQIKASVKFLRRFERRNRVNAAFWVKESGGSKWRLYIAPHSFDVKAASTAYLEVLDVSKELDDPYFDPLDVTIVGLDEPMVREALDAYKNRPPKIPIHLGGGNFGGVDVDEVHLIEGSNGEYKMPSGRQVLDEIIDREAEFFEQHGTAPRKMRLPVLMAYDLAKCGREELGEISGRVFKDGINVFEKEGLHGMKVEILRDRSATLQFE